MEFYQILAKYYNEIFTLKDVQRKFLRNFLASGSMKSVLDIGCATGQYVFALEEWGLSALGVDLSSEMLEIAVLKAEANNSRASFLRANMLDLSEVSEKFDAVICLGNTLAHLTTEEQLKQALCQFRQKGSNLLLQLVNYDRVQKNGITELPLIETEKFKFKRFYEQLPQDLIEFRMELELVESGEILSAANTLHALTREKMGLLLKAGGWNATQYWGSFGGEAWTEESPASIIAAI